MEMSGQPHTVILPGQTAPGTHKIGGWTGPRACMDALEEREIPFPNRIQTKTIQSTA